MRLEDRASLAFVGIGEAGQIDERRFLAGERRDRVPVGRGDR
jgi:hypothetical protein